MNFNRWYGLCILACIMFWMAMFSLFRGCGEAQAREAGPGFYVEAGKDIDINIAYTELQIGYNFNLWGIFLVPYGNQKTWFEIKDSSGRPFKDIYTVGVQLIIGDLTFDFSHFCSHNVASENSDYIRSYSPPLEGTMSRFSARYSFN